jgi:hypothetical protein
MYNASANKLPDTANVPPISDYIGLYTYDSFSWNNGKTGYWIDLSGNGNHALIADPSAVLPFSTVTVTNGNKTFKAVTGTNQGTILWPITILPSTYTLFYVAKNTSASGRIFQGYDQNWLSTWWSSLTGVAYHGAWIGGVGAPPSTIPANSWVYATDQNNLYRAFGNTVVTGSAGSPSYTRLAINTSINVIPVESANFQIAEVIVYNRTLSAAEYTRVEQYLAKKYGFST